MLHLSKNIELMLKTKTKTYPERYFFSLFRYKKYKNRIIDHRTKRRKKEKEKKKTNRKDKWKSNSTERAHENRFLFSLSHLFFCFGQIKQIKQKWEIQQNEEFVDH